MDRFRRMEIFNAVVEAGQFTRAAATLNLSKSAVSHAITDLEKFLGVQLLIRSNRSLNLTAAGQDYYQRSVHILSELSDIENTTRQSEITVSGRIRITAPVKYASNLLSPIISSFMSANPEVSVEMVLTERNLDLIEEGLDFAVRFGNLKDSRLVARKISTTSHKICASPSFIKAHDELVDLNALKQVNCLKFTGNPVWKLTKNGRSHSFTPKGTLVSNNGEALRNFALAGQGVAFIPGFLTTKAIQDGSLVHILTDYQGHEVDISIVKPHMRHTPIRVSRLIDLIAQTISTE